MDDDTPPGEASMVSAAAGDEVQEDGDVAMGNYMDDQGLEVDVRYYPALDILSGRH